MIPGYDAWKLMTPEDAEESYGHEMLDDDDGGYDPDFDPRFSVCDQFYDGG